MLNFGGAHGVLTLRPNWIRNAHCVASWKRKPRKAGAWHCSCTWSSFRQLPRNKSLENKPWKRKNPMGRGPLSPMNPWVQWIFSPSLEKGNLYWRYTHFALNHDDGSFRKSCSFGQFPSLFSALNNFPSEVKKTWAFWDIFCNFETALKSLKDEMFNHLTHHVYTYWWICLYKLFTHEKQKPFFLGFPSRSLRQRWRLESPTYT